MRVDRVDIPSGRVEVTAMAKDEPVLTPLQCAGGIEFAQIGHITGGAIASDIDIEKAVHAHADEAVEAQVSARQRVGNLTRMAAGPESAGLSKGAAKDRISRAGEAGII